jgi:hypothetical protein
MGSMQTQPKSRLQKIIPGLRSLDGQVVLDFHPTPEVATRALLEREAFKGNTLEPASGNGAISRLLEAELGIHYVYSSDLETRAWVYGKKGANFLTSRGPVDNVITNPPYRLLNAFILHALYRARRKVAMLVNQTALFGRQRFETVLGPFPPARVYLFARGIPYYHRGGWSNTGGMSHAWVVWDKKAAGTQLEWILHEGGATDYDKDLTRGIKLRMERA